MNKCVCDICGANEVRSRFKFKQEKKAYDYSGLLYLRWENVDICDSCYHKFVRLRNDMKLEDELLKAIDECIEKYPDNPNLQSVYLDGVETASNLLLHNKIRDER